MGHGGRASQGRDAALRRRLPHAPQPPRDEPPPARVFRPAGRRGTQGPALGHQPRGRPLAGGSAGEWRDQATDEGLRAAVHRGPGRAQRHPGPQGAARPRHELHPRRARRGLSQRSRGSRLPADVPGPARRPRRHSCGVDAAARGRRQRLGGPAAGQSQPKDHLAVLADRPGGLRRQRDGSEGAPAPHLPQGHRNGRGPHPRPRAVPLPRPHVQRVYVPARRRGVPRLPRRRGRAAGLSSRRRARPRRASFVGQRARPRVQPQARQGRILGLRDGARRAGRLAGAGLHAQARHRRHVREAGAGDAAGTRARPAGLRQPQRALAGRRHRDGARARARRQRLRDPDAARHGRAHQTSSSWHGPASSRVRPGRRAHPRHGLPGAAAAREHGQRFLLAADVRRRRRRGGAHPAPEDLTGLRSRACQASCRRRHRPRRSGAVRQPAACRLLTPREP